MTAPFTIEVRSRIMGLAQAPSPLDTVLLEMLVEKITLAELIQRTVEEQVRELVVRRRLQAEEAASVLGRQYMTAQEIAEQAARGAVRYPSKHKGKSAELNPAAEAKRALKAFEAGAYMVYADGRRIESLAEEVTFAPGTKVTFLRLMPLRGG